MCEFMGFNYNMGFRKCSHCGKVGHNSRTCPLPDHHHHDSSYDNINNGGSRLMKLFGVQLHLSSSSSPSPSPSFGIKKSFSVDCLSSSLTIPSSSHIFSDENSDHNYKFSSSSSSTTATGYLSDGFIGSRSPDRKKGIPWTEEEHRIFLVGLEKLGKGDWRGISRNFVTTRTPTQVASHAQKYFLRRHNLNTNIKRRRPSLFDMDEQEVYKNKISSTRNESYSTTLLRRRRGENGSPEQEDSISDELKSSQPNLDLTLAAPQTLHQSKPSSPPPNCLLTPGTIAVI